MTFPENKDETITHSVKSDFTFCSSECAVNFLKKILNTFKNFLICSKAIRSDNTGFVLFLRLWK